MIARILLIQISISYLQPFSISVLMLTLWGPGFHCTTTAIISNASHFHFFMLVCFNTLHSIPFPTPCSIHNSSFSHKNLQILIKFLVLEKLLHNIFCKYRSWNPVKAFTNKNLQITKYWINRNLLKLLSSSNVHPPF